ncbi:MAG: tyrosine--tRNA ligase [Candidatus Nealsonbacteria bacterium CG10_big_fil_rev_8_21_14_0_10_36_228]|uniref:Tyrosine--tRNA ligase n=2 Tax=Candidatus Nealsoniibacteriota TaxID=1817911 RepID=A0A2H0TK52_9BACT|nr:MAG: tyrosine--tRNA ligase [Candidatus Nealsonbacteria bacterium CG23_combo_of_CG06-09_8_20_14_all_36_125]PIR72025.1 MAG: tyrosine--tRNA ligase [Candidatus Nealsonbacteria bacterium CG10_big_fil_rev_8_21_14_0_10_36_228]
MKISNRVKIITNPLKIEEVLSRGVEKIYPSFKDLEKIMLSGKRLRLYCGYDPTAPTLHIGHMVTLKKLAQFQTLGHEVIMLIGDFTGMIGDPTEKIGTRKKLSREEVLRNSKNYKKLTGKILKFSGLNPCRLLYNSKWLDSLSFTDLIKLASNFTVQQMIIRYMFQERIRKEKPIYLHEFLYPLAQAYDSVAMDVDLEIGGKDQAFNMLCGRDLMKVLKNKEKFVLATKLLITPEGKKMGKTEGNLIPMDENPKEMYGKIMSWPDSLITIGFELCTDLPMEEITEISNQIKKRRLNPREAKAKLAREIVTICRNKRAAQKAEEEFNRVFKEEKLPSRIPEIKIREKALNILDLLVKIGLASSKSEAKRLILQKGVKINNQVQDDWQKIIEIKKGIVIQVGKRKFIRLI